MERERNIECQRVIERRREYLADEEWKRPERLASFHFLPPLPDACATLAVYQGPQQDQDDSSKFTIQEPKETFQTLRQLRNIVEELQRQHNVRSDTAAQYGSL